VLVGRLLSNTYQAPGIKSAHFPQRAAWRRDVGVIVVELASDFISNGGCGASRALHQTRIEVHPRWVLVRGELERGAGAGAAGAAPSDLEIRRFPHAVLLRLKMCRLTGWVAS